jgi:hypothetical protein
MGLAENGQMNEQTSERRDDPRVTAEYRVHVVVSLHGFDADDRRFEAKGLTVNLGHRGALVRVNRAVTEGARCLMHLPDGDKRIGKTLIYGTVLRSRKLDDDTFEIAIKFDTRIPSIAADAD